MLQEHTIIMFTLLSCFAGLQLKSAPNRYIVKLKPATTIGAIASICSELNGKLANTTHRNANVARRFQGICNTPLSTVSNSTMLVIS
jgi:hypothetical protein